MVLAREIIDFVFLLFFLNNRLVRAVAACTMSRKLLAFMKLALTS